jgi:hypothetical protein
MEYFEVNKYISLKLEEGKVNIYVKGEFFQQCKHLLLNVPLNSSQKVSVINSIDEATEILGIDDDRHAFVCEISLEAEFWAHCSNLQTWAEYDYDTRLLHSNLAFPLLLKLTSIGDPKAERAFKEELVKRIRSGNLNTCYFLVSEEIYPDLLEKEELDFILLENNPRLRKTLEVTEGKNRLKLFLLETLTNRYNDPVAKDMLKESLREVYISGDIELIRELKQFDFYDIFNFEELKDLIFRSESPITCNLLALLENAHIALESIYKSFEKYKTKNSIAAKYLLLDYIMLGSEYTIGESDLVREDFSEESMTESFESILKLLD